MQIIERAGAYTEPDAARTTHWVEQFRTADLSVGTYSIRAGGQDGQQPHTEDEIYVVTSGQALMVTGSATVPVHAGDTIFVPAREPHHFAEVSADLAVLVIFGPAEGARS
jgi:mannose-6-phosphate isomerase-like protein (cupin superfamily)